MNLKIIEKRKPKIRKDKICQNCARGNSCENGCLRGYDFVEIHSGVIDDESKLLKMTRVEFKKFNYLSKYFKD